MIHEIIGRSSLISSKGYRQTAEISVPIQTGRLLKMKETHCFECISIVGYSQYIWYWKSIGPEEKLRVSQF